MCKYCKESKKFSWGTYTNVCIEDGKLVVYAPDGEDISKDEYEIDYCPKCGEKLNK